MSLYAEACLAVNTIAEEKLQSLKSAADAARQANITATRDAVRNLVPVDDPFRPVCEYLANGLTIGRDDGYPSRNKTDEMVEVYLAAIVASGADVKNRESHPLLKLMGNSGNLYLTFEHVSEETHAADYAAWNAHREFEKKFTRLS